MWTMLSRVEKQDSEDNLWIGSGKVTCYPQFLPGGGMGRVDKGEVIHNLPTARKPAPGTRGRHQAVGKPGPFGRPRKARP
jgi:hypothetical protein